MTEMKTAIDTMRDSIAAILREDLAAVYLFGSVTTGDFRLGWSDIDIICFTKTPLTTEQSQMLVTLRQTLLKDDPCNPYYRSFEGAILPFADFLTGQYKGVVYWGTSGERITDQYEFDRFSRYEWFHHGKLIWGEDLRIGLMPPTTAQLREAVLAHYWTIRRHAAETGSSLYSCGWLLDIARGIYTLRTGKVIAKTLAGEWALGHHLCPVEPDLRMALAVRKNPLYYKNQSEVQIWLASLGDAVQQFADVLERELGCFFDMEGGGQAI